MMILLRRVLLPATLVFITNAVAARADFADQYKVQQTASFDAAQFNAVNEGGVRYHLLKNGDIYSIGPSIWDKTKITTSKLGNLKQISRTQGDTCYFGVTYECRANIVFTDVQYKVENCNLYKYQRQQTTRGGEFGKIERSHIATCREGFTQRGK